MRYDFFGVDIRVSRLVIVRQGDVPIKEAGK